MFVYKYVQQWQELNFSLHSQPFSACPPLFLNCFFLETRFPSAVIYLCTKIQWKTCPARIELNKICLDIPVHINTWVFLCLSYVLWFSFLMFILLIHQREFHSKLVQWAYSRITSVRQRWELNSALAFVNTHRLWARVFFISLFSLSRLIFCQISRESSSRRNPKYASLRKGKPTTVVNTGIPFDIGED